MTKKAFHEQLAERIIEQLKEGVAPWQKPWEAGALSQRPYNASTGKPYRGANSLNLSLSGFSDPRWLTFQQAKNEGYTIKKGSKGTPIQVFKYDSERAVRDENGKPVKNEQGETLKESIRHERPIVRSFTVFNAEQIEGIPPLEPVKIHEWEVIDRAERILQGVQANIEHKLGDRAYYSLSQDKIVLPLKEQFATPEKYYATALHELGHWTGHPSRLDRPMVGAFGSPDYAKEELRAEIASMMLSQTIGTSHDPAPHLAYVASWIQVLENDPMEIVHAARDAEKIQDFVLERELESTKDLSLNDLQALYELKLSQAPDSLVNDARKLEKGMAVILGNLPTDMQEQAQRNFYNNQIELVNQARQQEHLTSEKTSLELDL